MHRALLSCWIALVGGSAFAGVPTTLTHQGRLLDAAGDPLTGPHTIEISLWDAQSGGAERWSESTPGVPVDAGYFSIVLGRLEAIDSDILDGPVWIEITVDQGAPLPRRELHSVPYAILAHGVRGGVVDASEIRVDGAVVIDGTGQIAWDAIAVPVELQNGDDDTLRDLPCADDQVPRFAQGGWTCANPASLVTWVTLSGVPADLRDGDQVGLTSESDPSVNALGKATLTCTTGQVPKWSGSAWGCATDAGLTVETDPSVNPLGKATLACTPGQIAKWNGTAWTCAADAGVVTEVDPTVSPLGKATLTCDAGQIPKWDGQSWRCEHDLGLTAEADPSVNALGKATLSCAAGQVAKWNGSAWACAADAGLTAESDPSVNALGTATLTCDPGQIPKWDGLFWSCEQDAGLTAEADPSVNALGRATLSCAAGQVAKWNGSAWACAADAGLTAEADPSVNALGKATLSCAAGQVAKWNGSAWACAADTDTNTTYTAGNGIAINGTTISTVASGACYTRWGDQTCAGGFTAVVKGRAGGLETYTDGINVECVSDQASVTTTWSGYGTRMMRADAQGDGMVGVSSQCAICCTGGCYTALGTDTCASGYTTVVSGRIGGVEGHVGAARPQTLCIDAAVAGRATWTSGYDTRLMRHLDVQTNGNSGGMQSVTNTCATCCK